MVKSLALKLICLLTVLLVFVPNLVGCEATSGISPPLLPSHFVNTPVPDVNLNGYIYFNQLSPIIVSRGLLQPTTPQISIESAQLWLGPNANCIGGAINFESQGDAQVVSQLMKSFETPVWSLANDKLIYVVNNDSGQWTSSLKNALTQQQMVNPAARYPEVQEDFTYFPSAPPLKPFVAGFIDLDANLVESIDSSLGLALTTYTSALTSAKISRISFVAYSAQPFTISSKTINEAYINSLQLGALVVGRSAYPGIVLSTFFDKTMTDAGFTKYTVNDVDLYEYPLGNTELLVAQKGKVIYVATSQSKQLTEKLLLSCF